MVKDTEIIPGVVRSMGEDATAGEVEDITVDTPGTGVHVGVKGTHPTLPIPKTVSFRSESTKTTSTELC